MSTTAGPVSPLPLPLEVRVVLDLVAAAIARDASGPIPARVIGVPWLAAELERYGAVVADPGALVALAAPPEAVRAAILAHRPARVWTVAAGPLSALLQPLRAAPVPFPPDLTPATWRELGYEAATAHGVQGVGALAWAFAARAWIAGRRPDLADRCRIGMIRSMVALGGRRSPAAVAVRAYRVGA